MTMVLPQMVPQTMVPAMPQTMMPPTFVEAPRPASRRESIWRGLSHPDVALPLVAVVIVLLLLVAWVA